MTPNEALKYMQDRKNGIPSAPDATDMMDKLRTNPEKYLTFMLKLMEFEFPKMQSTTVKQSGDKPKLEIEE